MSPRREEATHDLSAAGAGDAGAVEPGDVLGPCPSCRGELRVLHAVNPRTCRVERAIAHTVPFCTYYGETDPTTIERDVRRAQGDPT